MTPSGGAPRHEREVELSRRRGAKGDPFREGPEAAKARKLRSMALAVGLVAFVLLIFAVTVIRLGASVPHG